ncbi:hypothetical protein FF1_026913 [Malus domestica]
MAFSSSLAFLLVCVFRLVGEPRNSLASSLDPSPPSSPTTTPPMSLTPTTTTTTPNRPQTPTSTSTTIHSPPPSGAYPAGAALASVYVPRLLQPRPRLLHRGDRPQVLDLQLQSVLRALSPRLRQRQRNRRR